MTILRARGLPLRARSVLLRPLCFPSVLCLTTLLFIVDRPGRTDDVWKHKQPSRWTRAEALKLLRHSPWAKQEPVIFLRRGSDATYSIPTGTRHCDPDAIDQNGDCLQKLRIEVPLDSSQGADAAPRLSPSTGLLIRWESAEPIAAAFARLRELGETEVVAFQAPPPRTAADRYVITVKVEQPGWAGFDPFAVTPAGRPVLRASLKTSHGIAAPFEVEFTGVGATSAVHFSFPRRLDGVSLLTAQRESVEFTLLGPGFSVRSKFALELAHLQTAD
jgi:hypothetical protein